MNGWNVIIVLIDRVTAIAIVSIIAYSAWSILTNKAFLERWK